MTTHPHAAMGDHAYALCAAFPSTRETRDGGETGNPAAVVVVVVDDDRDADEDDFCRDDASTDDYQRVATSLNLSETAFVRRGRETAEDKNRGVVHYYIRWFTPTTEIGLCGHASVASAATVLSKPEHGCSRAVRFTYAAGSLTISRDDEDEGRYIMEMDASAPSAFEGCEDVVNEIRDAFETNRETVVCGAKFSCTRNAIGDTFLLIEKTDEGDGKDDDAFRAVVQTYASRAPDLKRIARVGGRGVCVVIPSAAGVKLSESSPDYAVRWFGPNVGIDEDPVTGSACCGVTPLLSARRSDTDSFMFGEQLSARTGHLWSRMKPGDASKVQVAGRVIFTGEGIARHPYTE